jgi:hypothetical protein
MQHKQNTMNHYGKAIYILTSKLHGNRSQFHSPAPGKQASCPLGGAWVGHMMSGCNGKEKNPFPAGKKIQPSSHVVFSMEIT